MVINNSGGKEPDVLILKRGDGKSTRHSRSLKARVLLASPKLVNSGPNILKFPTLCATKDSDLMLNVLYDIFFVCLLEINQAKTIAI